ncbi:hypothetical protein Tcan_15255 [Toxocara canis]|uniref:Uncharacterized protein n=1 Tax=Toxocara canis TaxID=6265 RepID=A0A0B2VKA1_TOXCA|nr:hypothetical protein Tcan_15255 [Toxocara canis]
MSWLDDLATNFIESSIAASYFSIQHSFVLLLLTFGRIAGFGQGIAYNCVLINMRQVFKQDGLLERVSQVFLVMAVIFAIFQLLGLLFLAKATQGYEMIGEEDGGLGSPFAEGALK